MSARLSYRTGAAKLIQPRKRAFHDPPPPAQARPALCAAHGHQGYDVTCPKATPNFRRVVAAIPEHTIRPLPLSPAFAVQRLNRIDQRQCFLRVVPVGTGQPDGERHASRVTNQMTLAPSLGAIRGIWTRLRTAVHGAD